MGAASVQEPAAASPTVEVVGNAFVLQYYHVLHHSPEHVHRFYQEESKMGRPSGDGAMGITTTMEAIKEKIVSLDYGELRAEIKTVDAQESFGGGVLVLVTGYLTGIDEVTRNFTQAFFLAPQDNGYFVLNDSFRYVENVKSQGADVPINEIENPPTPDRNTKLEETQTPILENPAIVERETVDTVCEPAVSSGSLDVKKEEPVAEIVNETPEVLQSSHDSINTTKEVQKKSYASIVKVSAPVASSGPAVAKDASKIAAKQIKVMAASVTETETPLSKDVVENGIQQNEEGHSIYIKALPMNATPSQVEGEFKQFGPIKRGGVQVRSSKGFCFGFVEFEEASAAQKAIQASPIMIAGHEVFAQEKKSTNSRVNNNKLRFPTGRGNGFKNEDDRGRGSNGGIRGGYGRGGFTNNSEKTSNANERGFYNRGGRNGYLRSDSNNDRNPSGVMKNKTTVPRITAVA